jgi:N-acetyl-gamma-glutamyl-phosphate reductase
MTFRVKIVGAAGYGGVGLIELLSGHPQAEIAALVNPSGEGPISSVWPHLEGLCDLPIIRPDAPEAAVECDAVIFCTPDGVGMSLAADEVARGARVVDFSGDFRAADADEYAEYARRLGLETDHQAPELLNDAVYGLPELHRDAIREANVVANPGCFAVGCILGLAPAVRAGLIDARRIICDAKSGVSGAGKKPKPHFHYPEVYENLFAYRLAGHQHVLEVERQLGAVLGNENGPEDDAVRVTFTPQVAPMTRGILSSLYAPLNDGVAAESVLDTYREAYADEPFVFVDGPSETKGTAVVRGSNRCRLTVACDERTGTFRVLAHIDNLMKGQASNAVQNLNIMFGCEETAGLTAPGIHP